MKHRSIWNHKLYLDYLFEKGEKIEDEELQSHWSRYLCVLVSGWIEVSVKTIFRDFSKQGPQELQRFVFLTAKMQSAKMGNIIKLTCHFSSDWGNELQKMSDGPIKDAIDNIVKNRHKIAHGETCDISFLRLKKYYEDSAKAVAFLEQKCC